MNHKYSTSRSRWLALAALVGAGLVPVLASASMMGGGMGPGMMMQQTQQHPAATDSADGTGLRTYVDAQGLSCFACHAASGRGAGPAFSDIAQRYAGKDDAQEYLAASIAHGVAGKWSGYPPMPGGLASPTQARELARLILQHKGQ